MSRDFDPVYWKTGSEEPSLRPPFTKPPKQPCFLILVSVSRDFDPIYWKNGTEEQPQRPAFAKPPRQPFFHPSSGDVKYKVKSKLPKPLEKPSKEIRAFIHWQSYILQGVPHLQVKPNNHFRTCLKTLPMHESHPPETREQRSIRIRFHSTNSPNSTSSTSVSLNSNPSLLEANLQHLHVRHHFGSPPGLDTDDELSVHFVDEDYTSSNSEEEENSYG